MILQFYLFIDLVIDCVNEVLVVLEPVVIDLVLRKHLNQVEGSFAFIYQPLRLVAKRSIIFFHNGLGLIVRIIIDCEIFLDYFAYSVPDERLALLVPMSRLSHDILQHEACAAVRFVGHEDARLLRQASFLELSFAG